MSRYQRRSTRQIFVGPVPVGGGAPVSVQSMTITKTADVDATLSQIYALHGAGADIVRCTCNDQWAAEGLARIVPRSPVPIVADIHFHGELALAALSEVTDHPLHLGITEAGPPPAGTIKATAGMAALLSEGIGDTIRYSLSADPVEEAKAGRQLLEAMGLRDRKNVDIIACPSCGRAEIDVYRVAREAQAAFEARGLPIQVAVMGCVVNGPGEARSADLGIAAGRARSPKPRPTVEPSSTCRATTSTTANGASRSSPGLPREAGKLLDIEHLDIQNLVTECRHWSGGRLRPPGAEWRAVVTTNWIGAECLVPPAGVVSLMEQLQGPVDGRLARSRRTRQRIVNSFLGLIEDGVTRPTAAMVAEAAGLSRRAFYLHFTGVEDVLATAVEQRRVELASGWQPFCLLGSMSERVAAFCQQWAELLEALTPLRRAALHEPVPEALSEAMARSQEWARSVVEWAFLPDLDSQPDDGQSCVTAALYAVTSWNMWDELRRQGKSVDDAVSVMARMLSALLEPSRT
jgi:AcrR family transcriptional regulator